MQCAFWAVFVSQKVDKYSSYPLYHSAYETYELVERFYDPTFKNHLAVARVRGGMVFELANSVIVPFDGRDYAQALSSYAGIIYNMSLEHPEALKTYKVSFGEYYPSNGRPPHPSWATKSLPNLSAPAVTSVVIVKI